MDEATKNQYFALKQRFGLPARLVVETYDTPAVNDRDNGSEAEADVPGAEQSLDEARRARDAMLEKLAAEGRANGNSSSPAQKRKMEIEWFDAATDAALLEPSNPLIEGLLDEGAMSVIYGDSNSGKTFVALDWGFHVSIGSAWKGKRVKHGLVVYVAAEGGKRIKRRLAALKKRHVDEHGTNAPKPLFALVRYPIDLRSNNVNLNELLALVKQAEKDTDQPCVWIIVDTLSRAMAGGDENSPVDMGRIVTAADLIRAETGAHFSYVHHTGKDAAKGARGHSLLRADTDTEIETVPGAITATKQRDMEGGFSMGFTLVDMPIGVDPNGEPIKSAVVEWGDRRSPDKSKSGRKSSEVEILERAILQTYDRLADGVLESIGFDGKWVRKVSVNKLRDELRSRGLLDVDDKGTLTVTSRSHFRRAKASLIDDRKLTEEKGLIWR